MLAHAIEATQYILIGKNKGVKQIVAVIFSHTPRPRGSLESTNALQIWGQRWHRICVLEFSICAPQSTLLSDHADNGFAPAGIGMCKKERRKYDLWICTKIVQLPQKEATKKAKIP